MVKLKIPGGVDVRILGVDGDEPVETLDLIICHTQLFKGKANGGFRRIFGVWGARWRQVVLLMVAWQVACDWMMMLPYQE
jgi:hypothetical protein